MRRCAKCRRAPVRYIEYWRDHLIQFDAEADGSVDPDKEGVMGEGRPYAVTAVCDCGHQWRLRGVQQITVLHPAQPSQDVAGTSGESLAGLSKEGGETP